MSVQIMSKSDIAKMRATCRLAAEVLDYIRPAVVPGVTTGKLDRLCHEFITRHGAIPAPLNYRGFPKSICASPNAVICHGIPSDQVVLAEGDIVNLDITTILDGFFGDTSEMFAVGEISDEAQKLIDVTRQSMWKGIHEVAPKKRIGDIGAAIFDHAHVHHGYGVVEAFCGHGIGRGFHLDPQIPHVGQRGSGRRIKAGMIFTIEPMLTLGEPYHETLADGWTAMTRDGSLTAQTEHTVLVTDEGFEVLTMRESAWQP